MVPDEAHASTPAYLTSGAVIACKYRVTRTLGQGGMGVVVEAWHLLLQERVALKFLLPEVAWHVHQSPVYKRWMYFAGGRDASDRSLDTVDIGTFE